VGDEPIRQRGDPTIYDVARLAGVSTATVSRALNDTGRIAPATRARIEQAVEQLGYRPNTIARSLVTKSTETLAFLLPDITNPFYAALVSGIQDYALEHGHTMLLCTTQGDAAREEQYLSLLRAKQVDGALVDGLVLPPDRIAAFVGEGFPLVCLDRDIESSSVPLVQVDNKLGGLVATDYLVGLGHSRIAHVSGAGGLRISEDRAAGYHEGLYEAGIDPDASLVAEGRFTEEGGHAATRALLESAPDLTAIFAANDLSALGVLSALWASGRRVPDDVSVIGFDDLRLSAYTTPPLTTIRQPAAAIAKVATEILIGLTKGEPARKLRHVFQPSIVVRSSTAARS
jgi:LacI family transcriptional regulator